MVNRRKEAAGKQAAVRTPAGRADPTVPEEDVYAKQERLFGTSELLS